MCSYHIVGIGTAKVSGFNDNAIYVASMCRWQVGISHHAGRDGSDQPDINITKRVPAINVFYVLVV
jgi:hypothetical protein